MTEAEQLYAEFLDVLTDTISGTDMMSKEWHQEMYRFWLATLARAQKWNPIETMPTYEDVLLNGVCGMAIGYKDTYGELIPSNVEAGYDMSTVHFTCGRFTHWMSLPSQPKSA